MNGEHTPACAVVFEGVDKAYAGRAVLRNFCLEVPGGEFLTVIGGSGSGKTTILKLINGLLSPDQGKILVEGHNIAAMPEADRVPLRRRMGYVIQGVGLLPHLSVRENITFVPRLLKTGRDILARRVSYLCSVVELDEALLERRPADLSGGQQQRVGIARALAALPRILLMDEPFGAVDAITRSHLQDQIARIHALLKMTIVFVTHDVDEALKLGTRVLVLEEGNIAQLAAPAKLVAAPATPFVAGLVRSHRRGESCSPELSEKMGEKPGENARFF